ncbi:DUF2922 domain-containing protein [Clostridium botulinum]|nr:DUF2922 domain-containing protein [Clostridium botulinum]NFL04208.1 DUF2922 domain-containing protein [Clostridium botulinum]
MAKTLLMKFKTDKDKNYSLRVNRVKNDAKEEDIKTLMDSLINNDVVKKDVKEVKDVLLRTS